MKNRPTCPRLIFYMHLRRVHRFLSPNGAVRGLGNAVPPSMMRQIASSLWYLDTEMP